MQFADILTRSPLMESVLRSAHLIAQTDASVLITGESGTGKELVAQAMHAMSPRRQQAFITVNCAALPESLAESLSVWVIARALSRGQISTRSG
jgi:Transcriptional regulator containing PAS, AAA-type ATPase, and DNA-binding domains